MSVRTLVPHPIVPDPHPYYPTGPPRVRGPGAPIAHLWATRGPTLTLTPLALTLIPLTLTLGHLVFIIVLFCLILLTPLTLIRAPIVHLWATGGLTQPP